MENYQSPFPIFLPSFPCQTLLTRPNYFLETLAFGTNPSLLSAAKHSRRRRTWRPRGESDGMVRLRPLGHRSRLLHGVKATGTPFMICNSRADQQHGGMISLTLVRIKYWMSTLAELADTVGTVGLQPGILPPYPVVSLDQKSVPPDGRLIQTPIMRPLHFQVGTIVDYLCFPENKAAGESLEVTGSTSVAWKWESHNKFASRLMIKCRMESKRVAISEDTNGPEWKPLKEVRRHASMQYHLNQSRHTCTSSLSNGRKSYAIQSLVLSRKLHSSRRSEVSMTLPLLDIKPLTVKIGDAEELHDKIVADSNRTNSERPMADMIAEYDRDVRPFLIANCLLLPNLLRHESTEFLHYHSRKLLKRTPKYLSSYDVMCRKDEMTEENWLHFKEHLARSRTYVLENWQYTIGNIEILYYDYGIKGPHDVGTIFRGESDASFNETMKQAKLSFIIWENYEVVCAEVFKGIPCSSIQAAEASAALALCWKAEDMKEEKRIENLLICTDSLTVYGVMSGSMTIKHNDNNIELYRLLRGMGKSFKKFIPVWRPRELAFLPDHLISVDAPLLLENVLKKFPHHLTGLPLFKVSPSKKAKEIINKFEIRPFNPKMESKFYVAVQGKGKLDAAIEISQVLRPSCIYAAIKRLGAKSLSFQQRVSSIFRDGTTTSGDCTLSMADIASNSVKSENKGQPILFVFDSTSPENLYTHLNAFTVFLIAPEERMLMKRKEIKELNALSYIYYHWDLVKNAGVEEQKDEEEADDFGVQDLEEDFLGASLTHPKYWWGSDASFPSHHDILYMLRSRNV